MFYKTVFVLLACLPSLYGQEDKAGSLRHKKDQIAAVLAVDQSISTLPEQLKKEDRLTAIILRDPKAHARRDTSEKILRDFEQKSLETAIHDQLAAFALTRPDLDKGWVDQAMLQQRDRIANTVRDVMNNGFHDLFLGQREIAVNAQRGTLGIHLSPASADVEKMAGPYRAFAELPLDEAQRNALATGSSEIEKYVSSAHAGQVIFEENDSYLKQQAIEIFSRQVTELWQQLHYIVQHTGAGEVERTRIENAIANGLSAMSRGHSPFPITKIAIHDRAAELEQNLFREFIKSQLTVPCGAISPAVVLKGVPSDPDQLSRSLDEQVAGVAAKVRDHTSVYLLEKWISPVTNPTRTTLRNRLEQGLKNGPGSQLLNEGIERCVRDALRSFRGEVAAKELAAKWPGVANLSLSLDDSTIERLNLTTNDEEAQQLPLLVDSKLHIEEAQNAFKENRRRLLEEGTTAVRKQMSIVNDPARVARFQNRLRDSPGKGSAQQGLQADYEGEVLAKWKQDQPALLAKLGGRPSNLDKYAGLFRVTREAIRNVLKNDGIESPAKSVSGAAAGPGGDGIGSRSRSGTGDGNGPGSGGGGGGGCNAQIDSIGALLTLLRGRPLAVIAVAAACITGLAVGIGYLWGRSNGTRVELSH